MTLTFQDIVFELKRIYPNQDTTNFGVFDFLSAFGSPVDALAYAQLFWPDFVEMDGMLLRGDVVEDESDAARVRIALRKWKGDLKTTERSFNRLDVPSGIFGKRANESSDFANEHLARIISEMWHARLTQKHPNRVFSVTIDREPDGEISVTFCQERQ